VSSYTSYSGSGQVSGLNHEKRLTLLPVNRPVAVRNLFIKRFFLRWHFESNQVEGEYRENDQDM
jgi:hypothetical protein